MKYTLEPTFFFFFFVRGAERRCFRGIIVKTFARFFLRRRTTSETDEILIRLSQVIFILGVPYGRWDEGDGGIRVRHLFLFFCPDFFLPGVCLPGVGRGWLEDGRGGGEGICDSRCLHVFFFFLCAVLSGLIFGGPIQYMLLRKEEDSLPCAISCRNTAGRVDKALGTSYDARLLELRTREAGWSLPVLEWCGRWPLLLPLPLRRVLWSDFFSFPAFLTYFVRYMFWPCPPPPRICL